MVIKKIKAFFKQIGTFINIKSKEWIGAKGA
jgi:hypothetical protein